MKKDIKQRNDVELLVDTFYGKVQINETLSPIFNEMAKVDWDTHLPTMYSFWASILLGEHSYSGNPMIKHIQLSKLTEMSEVQFSEWLHLFTETVDELFIGNKADDAKTRAANIARLMLHKIQLSE